MKFYYGIDEYHIDITNDVYEKCKNKNVIIIPQLDWKRDCLFQDPLPYFTKYIYIHYDDNNIKKYDETQEIKIILN